MIKQLSHFVKNMGWRYTAYRIHHELEKKGGILKKKHPTVPIEKQFISLDDWKKLSTHFLIAEREALTIKKSANDSLKEQTKQILDGAILFFSWEWKKLGKNYDWITNPMNGYQYDISKHWSQIPDFSKETGDIKYVWEKSRFTYLLTIIRNDYHNDEDHSEFVFSEIESWIDANPVNQGPNWRCSQEISLRIFNWCFALHFYKNSFALSEDRWNKIQHVIYWSLHHVYHHIDFSRIAVRNNHAITETLFLSLSEMLFPFIPETKDWAAKGRKWFEREIDYQIYDDGTFLQFSMNYHRVVIQLLSFGIRLSEINGLPFSNTVYEKAHKSVNFLYQCLQEENGYLPNYGANDGAWFFPLSDTDYRDYRPQLNTLHFILTGIYLYDNQQLKEDSEWLTADPKPKENALAPLQKETGIISFPKGGYYLIREKDTFSFIKCGSYKDRPSHADNLHLDIWYKGENLLCDAGSYMYNTDESVVKYFAGTESHNTVMLDKYDQMQKGARFIWFNWTQVESVSLKETEDEYVFIGKVKCFTYLDKNIYHERTILKSKKEPVWIIKDEITNKPHQMALRQLWHCPEMKLDFSSNNGQLMTEKKWISMYYGHKTPINKVEYRTNQNSIETKIHIL